MSGAHDPRLLEYCRVPAHQAVFIDDDPEFIQGAISTGMHGIHFQDLPALRAALEPMLATRASH
jgi:FMN phosphatase YigB (HAD superfamily)